MDITITLLIIAICLLLEGSLSGSEIGVVSADQNKLRHAAAKGAKPALEMLKKPECWQGSPAVPRRTPSRCARKS